MPEASSSMPVSAFAAPWCPTPAHISRPSPMESRKASVGEDGPSTAPSTPPLRRRYSMEEDLYYNHIMAAPQRRLSQPPAYEPGSLNLEDGDKEGQGRWIGKDARAVDDEDGADTELDEPLPNYQNSVYIEGVFSKKHEIEDTIKRAEDRHWHTVFVTLNGTALNVYTVKKDWGWGRSRDGPTICPDNPPWVRKSKLEKSYSLLHADCGIAADYNKRRYVIRIRAETDQFLLSCVELSTFVKWLEFLFAAIDVAAPIDDRDFPRDMSIPRIQRIRWFQGQSPALPGFAASSDSARNVEASADSGSATNPQETSTTNPPETSTTSTENPRQSILSPQTESFSETPNQIPATQRPLQELAARPPPRIDPRTRRLSNSSYTNAAVDPHSGKWLPEHQWTNAHDLLYAKLCYSNLLFRSPRKSNYIISKGKQWFVDWGTGKMVRVLPPAYGESDFFGPWQVIHTENPRI